MKQIPLLQGKALLVELPEGATKADVISRWLEVHRHVDGYGFTTDLIDLPPGNWRIIGMLSEVTEEQASNIVEDNEIGICYRDYQNINFGFDTALASLESAILAEGYVFENNLINPDDVCYFSRDRMIDDVREYHEAQSRVLDRSRCLLLGREDV